MDVFVYGTLAESARANDVLDTWTFVGEAVLHGLHRVDGTYPTLAPGGRVEGRLLRTDEVDRLDRYESVAAGLYVRVSVPLVSGSRGARRFDCEGGADDTVAVYVGDPERLVAPAEWPGEGGFAERVRAFVEAHDVVVHPVGEHWDHQDGRDPRDHQDSRDRRDRPDRRDRQD